MSKKSNTTLFWVLLAATVVDWFFLPDPLPLVDELVLTALTYSQYGRLE